MLVMYAIPAFVVLMIVEALVLSPWGGTAPRARRRGYEGRDTAASLAMGLGNVVIGVATQASRIALMIWIYQFRLFDMGTGVVAWAIVLIGEDFTYYWWHRASHEIRFMWAAHENHHSSQHYNLSTALRQSWTTPFTTLLFYAPLPLLGFNPAMLAVASTISLLYQFWIHTEVIDRLGPLEQVFNTPSHHRVHHGSNIEYLDRNHAGILIIWDRLFGTFEPEVAAVRYGLTKNIDTFNPVRIAFLEWAQLVRDVRCATTWRARLGYIFCAPGWKPDGASTTSRLLRERRTQLSGVGEF